MNLEDEILELEQKRSQLKRIMNIQYTRLMDLEITLSSVLDEIKEMKDDIERSIKLF